MGNERVRVRVQVRYCVGASSQLRRDRSAKAKALSDTAKAVEKELRGLIGDGEEAPTAAPEGPKKRTRTRKAVVDVPPAPVEYGKWGHLTVVWTLKEDSRLVYAAALATRVPGETILKVPRCHALSLFPPPTPLATFMLFTVCIVLFCVGYSRSGRRCVIWCRPQSTGTPFETSSSWCVPVLLSACTPSLCARAAYPNRSREAHAPRC